MTAAVAPSVASRLSAEWRTRLEASGLPLSIREMLPEERGFVHETTCRVRWPQHASSHARTMPWAQWLGQYAPRLDKQMGDSRTLVAVTEGIVLGYAIADRSVSMLYVKRDFRGHGIGLMLLEHTGLGVPVTVIDPTPQWMRWAERHDLPWEAQT